MQEQADYIGALRAAADQAGVELVINACTDAFMGTVEVFDDPLAEAVRPLQACVAAVPAASTRESARRPDTADLAGRTGRPGQHHAQPADGAPSGSFEDLQRAGVQRITFGPLLMAALTDKLTDLITPGR